MEGGLFALNYFVYWLVHFEVRRHVGMVWGDALEAAAPQHGPLPRSLTTQGEPQLLAHLAAQRLLLLLGVALGVPAELQDGHHDGHGQPAEQDHEHSSCGVNKKNSQTSHSVRSVNRNIKEQNKKDDLYMPTNILNA